MGTLSLASVTDVRYFVAARGEIVQRPGVRAGRLTDVTDLAPDGDHHAVSLADFDVTVCGRDVDRPLTRFLEHDFDTVPSHRRCPDCSAELADAG